MVCDARWMIKAVNRAELHTDARAAGSINFLLKMWKKGTLAPQKTPPVTELFVLFNLLSLAIRRPQPQSSARPGVPCDAAPAARLVAHHHLQPRSGVALQASVERAGYAGRRHVLGQELGQQRLDFSG